MSLEFAVDFRCALRARYDENHLREWGRLANLHTILTTGDQSAPGPDKLQWIESTAAEIDLLQSETAVCSQCPACLPLDTIQWQTGRALGTDSRLTLQQIYFRRSTFDPLQLVRSGRALITSGQDGMKISQPAPLTKMVLVIPGAKCTTKIYRKFE